MRRGSRSGVPGGSEKKQGPIWQALEAFQCEVETTGGLQARSLRYDPTKSSIYCLAILL